MTKANARANWRRASPSSAGSDGDLFPELADMHRSEGSLPRPLLDLLQPRVLRVHEDPLVSGRRGESDLVHRERIPSLEVHPTGEEELAAADRMGAALGHIATGE
jgi:hypothetical protein